MVSAPVPPATRFRILPAEPRHRAAWDTLYAGYAAFYRVKQTPEMRERVWSWIQDSTHEVEALIAEDTTTGEPVGLAHYRPFARPLAAATAGFLDDLFVAPERRGERIADALIAALTAIGRERGWTVIRWLTADDNYRGRGVYDRVATRTMWLTYEVKPDLTRMDLDFTEAELHRYSRHILLREVGAIGQAKLRAARVLIVGAGGLGSPLALYLSAAGVGTLGIVDDDALELSNLQRQVAHTTARIGHNKAASAAESIAALNPEVRVETHPLRLDATTAAELVPRYDLVCDGTDNFATRFIVGDACHRLARPLVTAAVLRFEGQLSVFEGFRGPPHPCHRCLHPEPPPDGLVPSCSEAGVLGAVTGVMGTLQATEVLKLILGIGETLSGRLLLWDALDARFRTVRLKRDPACRLCGG